MQSSFVWRHLWRASRKKDGIGSRSGTHTHTHRYEISEILYPFISTEIRWFSLSTRARSCHGFRCLFCNEYIFHSKMRALMMATTTKVSIYFHYRSSLMWTMMNLNSDEIVCNQEKKYGRFLVVGCADWNSVARIMAFLFHEYQLFCCTTARRAEAQFCGPNNFLSHFS